MADLRGPEQRYYEAFNSRQFERYGEFFTEDVELIAPGGLVARGLEAMKAFDRGWTQGFSDARITLTRQVADAETVASENLIAGTHDGILRTPGGDLPPTVRHTDGEAYTVVVHARDGKFSAMHVYYDQIQLPAALVLMPNPAGAAA